MKVIPNYVAFSFIICTAINTMYSRYSRCMVVLLYQSEMDNRAINPIRIWSCPTVPTLRSIYDRNMKINFKLFSLQKRKKRKRVIRDIFIYWWKGYVNCFERFHSSSAKAKQIYKFLEFFLFGKMMCFWKLTSEFLMTKKR